MPKFICIQYWHPSHIDEFGQSHEEKYEEYILNTNEIISITDHYSTKNQCKYCEITCKNDTYYVKNDLEIFRQLLLAPIVPAQK